MTLYRLLGTLVHIKFGKSKRPPPAPCCAVIRLAGRRTRCLAFSTLMCDWPTEAGGTCSAPLCADHAQEIGPGRHLCPIHAAQHGGKTLEYPA